MAPATTSPEPWRSLVQLLRGDLPPLDMSLYVEPGQPSSKQILKEFKADPGGQQKFLLVGGRGGGKSTELRKTVDLLGPDVTLATIDLDLTGINSSNVGAFDLLYLCALQVLRTKPDKALFEQLIGAYAGQRARELGTMEQAFTGIVSFGAAATAVAAAAGLATGIAPILAAGAAVGAAAAKLISDRADVVAETSSRGRQLQVACQEIARHCRAGDSRPICVMTDGLERMNGESAERFREIFVQTRLLADAPWSAVIAAPPCTLTEVENVEALNYTTVPVWGFGPDMDRMEELLRRRFQSARLEPTVTMVRGGLRRIAEASGGMPRHAVQIARFAALEVIGRGGSRVESPDVDAACRRKGEELGRGLSLADLETLAVVLKTERIPGGEAGHRLFATERVLAHPPTSGSTLSRYVVHPLLTEDVKRFAPPSDEA